MKEFEKAELEIVDFNSAIYTPAITSGGIPCMGYHSIDCPMDCQCFGTFDTCDDDMDIGGLF